MKTGETFEMDREVLDDLIHVLQREGFRVIGPMVADGAIIFDEIEGAADLPMGIVDRQEAGHYRLESTGSERLFDHVNGPHSLKQFLFPSRMPLVQVDADQQTMTVSETEDHAEVTRTAFLGVRSCDLAAARVQDKVFLEGTYPDPRYAARRERSFIIAVNCGRAGGTCFCVSMGTGPRADSGFDLALTELDGTFVVETGSEEGAAILEQVKVGPAPQASIEAAEQRVNEAAASMGRHLETEGLPRLLLDNLEHPRWQEVADRCLSCTNCTMVCPTCFCSTVTEETMPGEKIITRTRVWDSCFSLDFSHLHGGSRRPDIRHRYRQWMTHKLATWWEQFGTSGCIGCGRCITWCPTGIDITEEAAAIRADDHSGERQS